MIRFVALAIFLVGKSSAQVDVTPLVEEWTNDEMINTYAQVTWSTLVRDGEQMIVVDLPPANNSDLNIKLRDGNFSSAYLKQTLAKSYPLLLITYFDPIVLLQVAINYVCILLYQKNKCFSVERTRPES